MIKDVDPANLVSSPDGHTTGRRWLGSTGLYIAITAATLSGVLVFQESPLAFLAAMTDGVLAAAILAAASLAGLWVVWGTGNGDLPVRWQIGLGAGAGMGALSLGMLWAGLRGWMGQTTWWVVMGVLAALGLAALLRLSQRGEPSSLIAPSKWVTVPSYEGASAGRWRWLWLLVVPVAVLGVLAATVPPGWLWQEEANGYDVLEYHLGVPRDWFFSLNPVTHVQGQIVYLDHNMYSNFPMNAEMLYLLAMVLLGSPWKAAIVAQFISLLQGALCGYVAWLIGRDYSPRAGIIAGLAGAAMPWLTYCGALAYVENGMLFYGLLAAGLCNRAIREPGERHWSRALMLGLMAGLACGYKYTAIPMIALPLLGLWVALAMTGPRRSVSLAIIPLILAATAFAPWASKNQRMTGNPFFPLGNSVFGSRVWTPDQNQRFIEAHSPLPTERPVAQRFVRLWERVIAEPRFGFVPWIAAAMAAGLLLWRRMACRGQIAIWLAVLAVQILLWMFTTHLYARFAGVLWIPLVLLIAAVAAWATGTCWGPALAAVSAQHARRQGPKALASGDGTRNLAGPAECSHRHVRQTRHGCMRSGSGHLRGGGPGLALERVQPPPPTGRGAAASAGLAGNVLPRPGADLRSFAVHQRQRQTRKRAAVRCQAADGRRCEDLLRRPAVRLLGHLQQQPLCQRGAGGRRQGRTRHQLAPTERLHARLRGLRRDAAAEPDIRVCPID